MSTLKSSSISVAPQDIFAQSSTQQTDLGAQASTGDGRLFRYVLAGGTTLAVGKLQASPAQDTTNFNPSGGLGVSAAAIGATQVTITTSITLTANQLAGGYMSVYVTPGVGYTYRIKGNTAVSAAANCVITLEDALQVALTTSSKVVVHPGPYNGVIVNPATASGAPVGVAIYPITNAYYGWIQTKGVATLLNDTGTAVGLGLAPSASVAGAAKTMAATLCQIGYALEVQQDTDYGMVMLTME